MAIKNSTCLEITLFGVNSLQITPSELLEELSRSPYSFLDNNAYFQRFTNITITNITFPALETPYIYAILGTCNTLGASPSAMIDEGSSSTKEQVGSRHYHWTRTSFVLLCIDTS